MWLTAVITFNDFPLTRDGHMLLEIFPLHSHVTVFVCTGHKFKKARYQVNLLCTQSNKSSNSVMGLFNGFVILVMEYLSYYKAQLFNVLVFTSLFLSSPVHSQPTLGHLMAKERTFLSVALSGKTS